MPDFNLDSFPDANQGESPSVGQQQPQQNPSQFNLEQFPDAGQQNKPEQMGAGMAFLSNFNNAIDRLATGIIAPLFPQRAVAQSRAAKQSAADLGKQQHPIASMLGNVTGNIAGSLPLAAATSGLGPAASIAASAAGGAALGFATNPNEGESRVTNAEIGAVSGLAGGTAGVAAGKILKSLPLNKISKFFSQGTESKDVEQAAQRLGVEVSPYETTSSVNARAALPSKTNMTPDRAKQLSDALLERNTQLKQSFDETLNTIIPNRQAETDIYNSLAPRQIADEKLQDIIPQAGDKTLTYPQRLYKEAHDPKTGIDFADVKPGSFQDIKMTRDYINSKLDSATTGIVSAGGKGQSSTIKGPVASSLRNAKKNFTDALHSVSTPDELPKAEQMAKEGGFADYVKTKLSKIYLKEAGQQAPEPGQVYNKLFGTTEAKNNFYKKLNNALAGREDKEEILQKFNDWETVMSQLKDSPVEKLLGKNQFQSQAPTKELGEAGLATYMAGPTIGATAFGARVGGKMLNSKRYFDQIWKPVPEFNPNVGRGTQTGFTEAGLLAGQEANS